MAGEKYDYKQLLERYPDLRTWYDNLFNSSPSLAEDRLRRIGYVCRVYHTDPDSLTKLLPKEAHRLIVKIITDLHREEKSSEYMKSYVKALKSWFLHNDIKVEQKISIPVGKKLTKVEQEQSPVPEQLRVVLDHADIKARVECALVAFSGIRIEVLGDYLGKDGLRVKDFPEMQISGKEVSFTKVPTMIKVRASLSKSGKPYFTFLAEQGCDYVKELLEFRLRKQEKLESESPIITSIKYHNENFIRTTNISDSMRKAIRAAGPDWRPYILRVYFDTRLSMAEGDNLIQRDWRVFLMGHAGSIESRYTVGKARLPEDLIEKMREAYARAADKYLITTSKPRSNLSVETTLRKQILLMFGYSEKEISDIGDLAQLTPDDLNKLMRDKQKNLLGLNRNSQKVVSMADVKENIVEGWEFVTELPTGEAVMRIPGR